MSNVCYVLRILVLFIMGGSITPLWGEELINRAPFFSGTELRAGYRTQYIYRSRNVGHSIMETQFSSGLAISSSCDFNFSGYAYQSMDFNKFSNVGAYGEFVFHVTDKWTIVPCSALNYYRYSEFKTGAEWGVLFGYEWNKFWRADALLLYDTGQSGSYGKVQLHYTPMISEDVGLNFSTGIGGGYDYFEVRGISEFFLRMSIPVRISTAWVIEPFMGISLQGLSQESAARTYYGVFASFMF